MPTDPTPDTIRALADRLERRADIEDVGEVRYQQEDVPEVTWEEMREIVGLLREAASTLRALADQGQRAAGCINCGEARDGGYETEEVGPFCSEQAHAEIATLKAGQDARRDGAEGRP